MDGTFTTHKIYDKFNCWTKRFGIRREGKSLCLYIENLKNMKYAYCKIEYTATKQNIIIEIFRSPTK